MLQGDAHAVFLKGLEELYDLPAGSLQPGTLLGSLAEWTSLGQVEFMAFADEEYEAAVSGEQLRGCRRIADLESLVSKTSGAGLADGQ